MKTVVALLARELPERDVSHPWSSEFLSIFSSFHLFLGGFIDILFLSWGFGRQPGRFVCCTSMPLVELSLMLWKREFVSEPVMLTMVMMIMMMIIGMMMVMMMMMLMMLMMMMMTMMLIMLMMMVLKGDRVSTRG